MKITIETDVIARTINNNLATEDHYINGSLVAELAAYFADVSSNTFSAAGFFILAWGGPPPLPPEQEY